jgi:hypothetical protein
MYRDYIYQKTKQDALRSKKQDELQETTTNEFQTAKQEMVDPSK